MGDKKYIFVTGGVLSGVGKGITAASIGAVLKSKNIKISSQKCDAYLNVDAGLLDPAEHGEIFVTKDGVEADLDLGHYERFLDIELTQKNTTLSGRLMRDLIADERAGKFKGKTVQFMPHFTGAIKRAIHQAAAGTVHIVEIGGTVGDFESLAFIEAIREFSLEVGRDNCLFVHVVYVPYLQVSQEYKTKPAQNALTDLRRFGIMPDAVGIRTEGKAKPPKSVGDKIAMYSGVKRDGIISMPNVDTVYEVPLVIERDLGEMLSQFTGVAESADLKDWRRLAKRDSAEYSKEITVGLIAKDIENSDTYLSVTEAIKSAAWAKKSEVEIRWLDATKLTENDLATVDAVVVPGGFGDNGIDGLIMAADYCLKTGKPYLGISLGLQTAVIAAARLGGDMSADSSEFTPGLKDPIIILADSGKMRLGEHAIKLEKDSKVAKLYQSQAVSERHRHRYMVNQAYQSVIAKGGLTLSGTSQNGTIVEFIEATEHQFFVATQAHPEFKSRPFRPHPLFVGLIDSAIAG